jgi:hypothetical protein
MEKVMRRTGMNTGIQYPPIEYFRFEEDFVEENVRCIPMIVRFKMDAAGIKLKLAEWSRFTVEERIELAVKPCGTEQEAMFYNIYLSAIVQKHTGNEPAAMEINKNPEWSITNNIPQQVSERAATCDYTLTLWQWENLTDLQRFALLKLCRPGHESKNFTGALNEFGLKTRNCLRQTLG